jgi:hypothetical protein
MKAKTSKNLDRVPTKILFGIWHQCAREKPWRVAKGRNEKLLRFHNNPAKEILVKRRQNLVPKWNKRTKNA